MKKIRKTWTFGVVQAAKVLRDFGPSLFGIRAWFCVCKLGRTCGYLGRMIVEDHVFV